MKRIQNQRTLTLAFGLMISGQALAASVFSKTACELVAGTRDEYLINHPKFTALCAQNARLSQKSVTERSENQPVDITQNFHSSPAVSMHDGGNAELLATLLGRDMITWEEIANCAYLRRDERPGDIPFRFPFEDDRKTQLALTYRSLIGSFRLVGDKLDCSPVVDTEAKLICERIKSKNLEISKIKMILDDIKRTLVDIYNENDRAAGVGRLSKSQCSERILQSQFGPGGLNQRMLRVFDKTIPENFSVKRAEEQNFDHIIHAAEEKRLDRVYLDFMKNRLELIQKYELDQKKK
jgi:hypothetical protein